MKKKQAIEKVTSKIHIGGSLFVGNEYEVIEIGPTGDIVVVDEGGFHVGYHTSNFSEFDPPVEKTVTIDTVFVSRVLAVTAAGDKVSPVCPKESYIDFLDAVEKRAVEMEGQEASDVAFLHTLMKLTEEYSVMDLLDVLPEKTVNRILILTPKSGQDPKDYLNEVCSDRITSAVMIASLEQRMDIRKMPMLTPSLIEKLKGLHETYKYVSTKYEALKSE